MGRGVDIRRVGGKNSMSMGVKIPWLRVSKYHGWVRYTMDRGSIYHGYGVRFTMGRWVKIPWIGGSKYHG
jgi:hypothetical protein